MRYPRKRALFGLDGLDNMTSGSDVVEVQDYGDLDGDALNIALLMPESQRVVPGVLSGRAFADIDSSIQLQMVRDRFIDGQAECALRRHLDSFGPNTPMQNIVESCRVWESHNEAGVRCHDGSGRNSPRAVYQVTEDSQSPAGSTESEMLDEVIRRLLPTPTVPPPKAAPIPSDFELIQCLLGVIRPPQPGDTGAVSVDGHGNCVTELVSGWFSRGRGRSFFGDYCRVSGGI